MQLSIPNPALFPRAGPYSHAIVGYGIHWNHPAECTTPARGSCRPLLEIYLRRSSFRRRLFANSEFNLRNIGRRCENWRASNVLARINYDNARNSRETSEPLRNQGCADEIH